MGAAHYGLSGAPGGEGEQDSVCPPEYYGDEAAGTAQKRGAFGDEPQGAAVSDCDYLERVQYLWTESFQGFDWAGCD